MTVTAPLHPAFVEGAVTRLFDRHPELTIQLDSGCCGFIPSLVGSPSDPTRSHLARMITVPAMCRRKTVALSSEPDEVIPQHS